MTVPIRAALGTSVVVPLALLLAGAWSAAEAADDDPVVQGTWTIDYAVTDAVSSIGTTSGPRTFRFGEGCRVGEPCTLTIQSGENDPYDVDVAHGAGGISLSDDAALDCFDKTTGELSTPHGADYSARGKLTATDTVVRDGVTYVTALGGTLVETIERTAAGRASGCTIGDEDVDKVTQTTVLTGTPLEMPSVTPGEPSAPVAVDPADAEASGVLPEFVLPRSDTAVDSAEAVAAGRRSSVPGALVTPADAVDSLADRLPRDALLVAVLGLLIVFPAQIFNSTYEENRERIDKFLHHFRRGRGAPETQGRARRLGVFLGCAVVGTFLGGLLDPEFGANRASAALLVGVFVALLVAVLVIAAAGWVFRTARHRPHEWVLRAIPGALVVAVACVVVSRLTNFSPGYLFGLLGGAVFAGTLERRAEGRTEAVSLLAVLALALVSWVGFAAVVSRANEDGASFAVLAADALLGCLFIGGIEGLLFSLIPLKFLPGYRLRQWGWLPWAVLTAVVTFLFVHVLLVPPSGYLGRATGVSTTVTLALFVAFGVLSCAFWAWFRFRPDPTGPADPAAPAPPPFQAVPA